MTPTPPSSTTRSDVGPGLGRLISAAGAILSDGAGEVSAVPSGTARRDLRQAMQAALAEPDLLPPAVTDQPSLPASGVAKYLLHTSPAFTLLCLVTSPRALALTHDHGTWGVVGVYRGRAEEIRYVLCAGASPERNRTNGLRPVLKVVG